MNFEKQRITDKALIIRIKQISIVDTSAKCDIASYNDE